MGRSLDHRRDIREGRASGTAGQVRGDAVLVTSTDEAELKKLSGTLRGKFVLTDPAPDVAAFWTPTATRHSLADLDDLELATPRGPEFGTTPPNAGRVGGAGRGGGGGGHRSTGTRSSWPKTSRRS